MAPTLLGLAATLLVGGAALASPLPPGAPLGSLASFVPIWSPASLDPVVARVVEEEAQALGNDRGLRPGKPLGLRVLDRAHLAAERDGLGTSRRPPAEARAEASLRWRLGLGGDPRTEAGAPPARFEVTGLYDPIAKRVLVANWIPLPSGRFARWRDVAQALLDRRFALENFLGAEAPEPASGGNSDAILARQALIEGDATVQALEHLSPDGPPPSRVLAGIIEETRRTIDDESSPGEPLELARRLFVQLDGTAFVAALRARAPWSAVNEVWAHPPASTEQVLHPEKYQRREPPDDLAARLPAELPGGWRPAFRDTLGEIGARVFLERVVGEHRAARAAAGWAGDRVALYRDDRADEADGEHELVLWISTWDDVTDAEDFAEQAAATLGALAGAPLDAVSSPASRGPRPKRRGPRRWRQTDAGGRVFLLEQRGPAVGMLLSAPPELERAWPALMTAATQAPSPRASATRR